MNYINNLSSMTLGTVQLGMNYGIANNAGKPSEETSFSILRSALENGVTSLDTARAYGDSEQVIGRFLKTWDGEIPYITTKIHRLQGDTEAELEAYAVNSLETSLENLGVSSVDNVMLHTASDIFTYGSKAARVLESLIQRGYTRQVGVSVYNADELDEMMKYDVLTTTQVPMSIFDQRLIACGSIDRLKERNITVFVRSVFLQGLFFLNPDEIDDPILLEHAVPKIRLLREIANAQGMNVAQLAIAFMRDCAGVTSLVLGADNADQVRSNIAYFDTPTLDRDVMAKLKAEFAHVDIPEIMKVLSRPK